MVFLCQKVKKKKFGVMHFHLQDVVPFLNQNSNPVRLIRAGPTCLNLLNPLPSGDLKESVNSNAEDGRTFLLISPSLVL